MKKKTHAESLSLKNLKKVLYLFAELHGTAGIHAYYPRAPEALDESSGCFEYPKNPYFPESKISNPQKSFDHRRHLKFRVLPNPPPPPPPWEVNMIWLTLFSRYQ